MQLEVAKTKLQIFSRITQSLQFVILFSVGSLNLRGNMLIKYKKCKCYHDTYANVYVSIATDC